MSEALPAGPGQLVLSLSRVPSASREARAAIRSRYAGELDSDTISGLELVIAELVSNAVDHGRGTIHLALELRDGEIRGGVSDDGDGFDYEPRDMAGLDLRGRGLGIVSALVLRWGIRPGNTHVWFEMTATSRGA